MTKIKAILHQHVGGENFDKLVLATSDKLGLGGVLAVCGFDYDIYGPLVDSSGNFHRQFTDNKNACHVTGFYLTIVNGQEIKTKTKFGPGEVVALGLPKGKLLKWDKPIEDTLKEVKDYGANIILPHPYFAWGAGRAVDKSPNLITFTDSIEIFNPAFPYQPFKTAKQRNQLALELYENHLGIGVNIGACSNLDAHYMWEFEKTEGGFTYIEEAESAETITSSEKFNGYLGEAMRNASKKDIVTGYSRESSLAGYVHAAEVVKDVIKNKFKSKENSN
jgi:hypothetical protein